jgi:hypothetical protein
MNIFQTTVAFINSIKPGETYTSEQFKAALKSVTDRGYRHNGQFYRPRTYQTYLHNAGFITNVKRGVWRVNHSIPSWLTLTALEIARGYKGTQAERKAMKAKIKEYQESTKTSLPFKIGDKFIQRSDTNQVYTIEEHPTDSERIRVTWVDSLWYKQDGLAFTSYDKSAVTSNIANGIWTIVKETKTEIPKTETKRLAVFINNSSEYTSHFVLGQTYEIISETDAYYYIAGYKGVGDHLGGMYKWRFKELTNKTDIDDITIMCIDNLGYAGKLTIGKTYQASRKRNNNVDSKFWYIDEDDSGGNRCVAYKSRFVVLTDKVDNAKPPKREWKIGDTLLTSFLNDPNIEKEFYGFSNSTSPLRWENYRDRNFFSDRKVEEIKKVDGKLAALISNTMNLWISLQSLELHP